MIELTDDFPSGENRPAYIGGAGCVMLDPLTEIVVRMFMTIRIGRRQFMVNVLRHGEGGDRQQQQHKRDRERA